MHEITEVRRIDLSRSLTSYTISPFTNVSYPLCSLNFFCPFNIRPIERAGSNAGDIFFASEIEEGRVRPPAAHLFDHVIRGASCEEVGSPTGSEGVAGELFGFEAESFHQTFDQTANRAG